MSKAWRALRRALQCGASGYMRGHDNRADMDSRGYCSTVATFAKQINLLFKI